MIQIVIGSFSFAVAESTVAAFATLLTVVVIVHLNR